ncbi:MAG: hypothetical protein ACFFBP_00635 [Promethearchaeota archaeon]
MSKRYESRVDVLKEHKQDKDHKYHHTKYKSDAGKKKVKNQKKALKDFQKKMDKSKKIW